VSTKRAAAPPLVPVAWSRTFPHGESQAACPSVFSGDGYQSVRGGAAPHVPENVPLACRIVCAFLCRTQAVPGSGRTRMPSRSDRPGAAARRTARCPATSLPWRAGNSASGHSHGSRAAGATAAASAARRPAGNPIGPRGARPVRAARAAARHRHPEPRRHVDARGIAGIIPKAVNKVVVRSGQFRWPRRRWFGTRKSDICKRLRRRRNLGAGAPNCPPPPPPAGMIPHRELRNRFPGAARPGLRRGQRRASEGFRSRLPGARTPGSLPGGQRPRLPPGPGHGLRAARRADSRAGRPGRFAGAAGGNAGAAPAARYDRVARGARQPIDPCADFGAIGQRCQRETRERGCRRRTGRLFATDLAGPPAAPAR
jgi:hypothetical protein